MYGYNSNLHAGPHMRKLSYILLIVMTNYLNKCLLENCIIDNYYITLISRIQKSSSKVLNLVHDLMLELA